MYIVPSIHLYTFDLTPSIDIHPASHTESYFLPSRGSLRAPTLFVALDNDHGTAGSVTYGPDARSNFRKLVPSSDRGILF